MVVVIHFFLYSSSVDIMEWIWRPLIFFHQSNDCFICIFIKCFYSLILERDEGGERQKREKERETWICCSIDLCTHWLISVCAMTRDWTYSLGIGGWHSNQLSYCFICFEVWPNLMYFTPPKIISQWIEFNEFPVHLRDY